MYKFIFNRVKNIIPKISETEIIALKSGGTSIDRHIFEGKMNYKSLFAPIQKQVLSKKTAEDIDSLLKLSGQDTFRCSTSTKDTTWSSKRTKYIHTYRRASRDQFRTDGALSTECWLMLPIEAMDELICTAGKSLSYRVSSPSSRAYEAVDVIERVYPICSCL
jgi:hypothetical protein